MRFLTNSERLIIELKRREVRGKKEPVRLSVLILLDEGLATIPLLYVWVFTLRVLETGNKNMNLYPEI
jgi:hypothetical protein